jgi:hypothetical protein
MTKAYSNSTQISGEECTILLQLMRAEVSKNSLFDLFETIDSVPSSLCKRITGKLLKNNNSTE